MGLEATQTIAGLRNDYPLGRDPTTKGDDHIKLLKSVLKTTFPGAAGNGFAESIIATEGEINSLTGVTSDIQGQFDSLTSRVSSLEGTLIAPKGTRLVFSQGTAPTGWLQDVTVNDRMMRVVNGPGNGVGGSSTPISLPLAHVHGTQAHTLVIGEIPAHTHTETRNKNNNWMENADNQSGTYYANNGVLDTVTGSAGGGLPHEHGNTGSALTTWSPKYIDTIICEKQ